MNTTEQINPTRAGALLEIPEGLPYLESKAYRRGYAIGARRYVRKYGGPSAPTGTMTPAELRSLTIAHEWERHALCHKAGMAELRKHRRHPASVKAAEHALAVSA